MNSPCTQNTDRECRKEDCCLNTISLSAGTYHFESNSETGITKITKLGNDNDKENPLDPV